MNGYDRYATCGKCGKIVREGQTTLIYLDGKQIRVCSSCLSNIEGGQTGWGKWTPHWTKTNWTKTNLYIKGDEINEENDKKF